MKKFKFKNWIFEIIRPEKKIYIKVTYEGEGCHRLHYELEGSGWIYREDFKSYEIGNLIKSLMRMESFQPNLGDFLSFEMIKSDNLLSAIGFLLDYGAIKLVKIKPNGKYIGFVAFGFYNKKNKVTYKIYKYNDRIFYYPYNRKGKPMFYWDCVMSEETFKEDIITGYFFNRLKDRFKGRFNFVDIKLGWLSCTIGINADAYSYLICK